MSSLKDFRVIGVIRHPTTLWKSPDNPSQHQWDKEIKNNSLCKEDTNRPQEYRVQTHSDTYHWRLEKPSFVHLYNLRNSDMLIPFHQCLSSYPLGACVVFKYSNIPSLKADIVSWWPTGIYSGYANSSWWKNSQQPLLNLSQYVYV